MYCFFKSCRGLSPPHTPPNVPFMAYGGFSACDWPRNCCSCRSSLSLLVRYPDNSSAPLRGFGLAPLSIPRSRLRTFQYFLALLLYVLRLEWLPTPDSALPTGVVRFGGTMASADSLQTDYSAALSRFSRVSQDKARSFHTVQAEFTMRTLDRVSGVSIQCCLTSCTLALYSVLVHPVCVSPPASFPPHITVTQLPLAI